MGHSYIILTLCFIFLSASCSDGHDVVIPEKGHKKEAATPVPDKLKPKVSSKKRPNEKNLTAFFTDYGKQHQQSRVKLNTRLGEIELELYKDTPLHRANFLYNINEQMYYKSIFYRVVPGFMIQGGNSDNDLTTEKRKNASTYYIPNEVRTQHFHKRGALAMAMTHEDNPKHRSTPYSYYIVLGKVLGEAELKAIELEYDISITGEAREVYKNIGGAPHLDGVHTVFGEVVKGMDVVEAIAREERDSGDWPITDVVISYEILE